MPLSMYDASVPIFLRQLESLSNILSKAEASGIDAKELIDGRLAPDMLPLPKQVQIATDAVKGAVARLSGSEVPSFPDTETTFAELQERITKTVAYAKSVPPEAYEGSETREIVLTFGPKSFSFTGQSYLLHFVIPNFLFHVTTAYGILRSKGVQIGKLDYLGAKPD